MSTQVKIDLPDMSVYPADIKRYTNLFTLEELIDHTRRLLALKKQVEGFKRDGYRFSVSTSDNLWLDNLDKSDEKKAFRQLVGFYMGTYKPIGLFHGAIIAWFEENKTEQELTDFCNLFDVVTARLRDKEIAVKTKTDMQVLDELTAGIADGSFVPS